MCESLKILTAIVRIDETFPGDLSDFIVSFCTTPPELCWEQPTSALTEFMRPSAVKLHGHPSVIASELRCAFVRSEFEFKPGNCYLVEVRAVSFLY